MVEQPVADELSVKSSDSPASFQFIYIILKTQLKVEKFKNAKKSENTLFELQTIRNLNKQYKETYEQFLIRQS
jgi:hypothetical protein